MTEPVFLNALWIVTGTVGFLGLLRVVRRYLELRHDRRVPAAVDGLDERLARLERIELIVETTAVEVERISEANRFMAKLLAERGLPDAIPARPERVITPH